jgi:pyrimidine deaminase RibD-like protein
MKKDIVRNSIATPTTQQQFITDSDISSSKALQEESTTLNNEQHNSNRTAERLVDREFMEKAIELAQTRVGQRTNYAPYPRPVSAASLVSSDNRILGTGIATYNIDAIYDCLINSGLEGITPLHHEWFVSWPSSAETHRNIKGSTLFVTLEPCAERRGESSPPLAQLIVNAGISRVVIGCPDPVAERATKGASLLHTFELQVDIGIHRERCEELFAE